MSPCKEAMVEKVISINPENTVKQAIELFQINNIRSLPVVDEDNNLLGVFGLKHLMVALLPKSVTMQDGLNRLDFVVGGAPAVAKKLKKAYDIPVKELMDTNPAVLYPETSSLEAVRIIAMHGSPASIVDSDTGKFVGMITRQTILKDMNNLVEEMEKEGEI